MTRAGGARWGGGNLVPPPGRGFSEDQKKVLLYAKFSPVAHLDGVFSKFNDLFSLYTMTLKVY